MRHNNRLLLPAMLAAAWAAGPVLAQSTGTPGSATGSSGTTETDTRPSTAQGTTSGGTATGRGITAGTMQQGRPGDSVVMFRPRLSQLIGSNIYNDRNETTGEVDEIVLAAPHSAGSTSMTPGSMTPGTTTPGSAAMGTPGSATTTMPGMSASGMQQVPMAVIQVGGFLGMGGRLVMVPLSELQWNAERERIIMPNASKELLQGRPAFTYDSLRRG